MRAHWGGLLSKRKQVGQSAMLYDEAAVVDVAAGGWMSDRSRCAIARSSGWRSLSIDGQHGLRAIDGAATRCRMVDVTRAVGLDMHCIVAPASAHGLHQGACVSIHRLRCQLMMSWRVFSAAPERGYSWQQAYLRRGGGCGLRAVHFNGNSVPLQCTDQNRVDSS